MAWLSFCCFLIEVLEELSLDLGGFLAFDNFLALIQVDLNLCLWVNNCLLGVEIHLGSYFLALEHHPI